MSYLCSEKMQLVGTTWGVLSCQQPTLPNMQAADRQSFCPAAFIAVNFLLRDPAAISWRVLQPLIVSMGILALNSGL